MGDQYRSSNNNIYAILDAARIFGEPDSAQTLQTNFLSLYMGQSEDLLSSAAPYLFSYRTESEFGKWLLEKGWGNSWGMYVETNVPLEDLRKHFRKFLVLKTEEGKELYFRFYDPRVLRTFLPTCNEQQLLDFFGPIKMFAMESEDPAYAIKFVLEDGHLVYRKIHKEEFWNSISKPAKTIPKAVGIETKAESKIETGVLNPIEITTTEEESLPVANAPQRKWSFLVE